MGRGGHPDLLECGGSLSVPGDVLRDGAEAATGVGAAGDKVGFTGILVKKLAGVADDPAEVIAGGSGEGAVPAQGREVVLGSRRACSSGEPLGVPLSWTTADDAVIAMPATTKNRSSDLVLLWLCMPIKYHATAAGR
jgi:hypothetical protein